MPTTYYIKHIYHHYLPCNSSIYNSFCYYNIVMLYSIYLYSLIYHKLCFDSDLVHFVKWLLDTNHTACCDFSWPCAAWPPEGWLGKAEIVAGHVRLGWASSSMLEIQSDRETWGKSSVWMELLLVRLQHLSTHVWARSGGKGTHWVGPQNHLVHVWAGLNTSQAGLGHKTHQFIWGQGWGLSGCSWDLGQDR